MVPFDFLDLVQLYVLVCIWHNVTCAQNLLVNDGLYGDEKLRAVYSNMIP